ncbi:type IV pilus assembly PilZ [Desulfobulbus propionicus DSM 2032]|uniref:Type IV pilus assembly PilZ n=2 Tax=Desulfobulbus propionicus TaxID=894 RepID=A0A7U3YMX8_DESPD|nr:type IV pilus assembly PilZ [Desulfobulbus propionicus DSM 2032]
MPLLNSFFLNLKEGTALRAAIPLVGVLEKARLNCFLANAEPPRFTLSFPHGSLAMDQVDISRTCMVIVDLTDQTVTVSADIERIADPSTLELVARESVTHTQTRNYFRVDAATRVAASSVVPPEMAKEGESWRLLGDTIDLSGSGLLCSFSDPLEKDKPVNIELILPTRNMEVIRALGHVVRCRKIEENLYHVALHFDQIDPESQDKIMACCFELQRRYLRMRVQLESQPPSQQE